MIRYRGFDECYFSPFSLTFYKVWWETLYCFVLNVLIFEYKILLQYFCTSGDHALLGLRAAPEIARYLAAFFAFAGQPASGFAPAFRSASTTWSWPSATAYMRGVLPEKIGTLIYVYLSKAKTRELT